MTDHLYTIYDRFIPSDETQVEIRCITPTNDNPQHTGFPLLVWLHRGGTMIDFTFYLSINFDSNMKAGV